MADLRIKRTSTPNSPPADGSLQPGELAVEMDLPTRLWVGVPVAQDATGKKLLIDTSASGGLDQATADGLYVNVTGDEMTGGLMLTGAGDSTNQQLIVAPSAAGAAVIGLRKNGVANAAIHGQTSAGLTRMSLTIADTADNLSIGRFDDAGVMVDAPFKIDRLTGVTAIPNGATVEGGAPVGKRMHTADTPPVAPAAGDLWWHSNLGKTFTWYTDANGSQWVEV